MIVPINAREYRKEASRLHCRSIVETARRRPGITRGAIARELGISLSLVNTYAGPLLAGKWLAVREKLGVRAGRKSEALTVSAGKASFLCLALFPGRFEAAIFDFSGTRMFGNTFPVPKASTQRAFLSLLPEAMNRASEWARSQTALSFQTVLCLDGAVIQEYATVMNLDGFSRWTPLSLENRLQGRVAGVPWTLSRTTALLNYYAISESRPEFLMLKLDGALGLGHVRNNAELRGNIGTAGPLAHLALDSKGPLCECGERGCLEAIADPVERWRIVKKALLTGLRNRFKARSLLVLTDKKIPKQGTIVFAASDAAQLLTGVYHCAAQKMIENGI